MALAASLAGAPLRADGDAQAVFVGDHDHVSILELTGNYDRNLSNGELNVDPRAAIAREFFRTHPDDYDFIIVFTGFSFNLQDPQGGGGEVKAFYSGVRNGVQGIGIPQFDNGSAFGSAAKLQGYVDMAALSSYTTNPLAPDFEQTLLIMAHEVLHQWAAHVRFRQADGSLSSALLGESASHWSFLLDTSASVLYGNQWRDNGDGTFTSTGRLKFFSPLDLYLAGFLAPEEVPPFRLIDSPGTDPARLPETGVTVSGQARTVRIEDVIAAEGPRVPAAGAAPHDLRAAFLYLLRPGQTAAAEDLAVIEGVRRAFETRFSVLTGGRGVLRIYPAGQSDGAPGDPVPIDPGTPGAGSVDVTRALAWLRSRQTAAGAGDLNGYWEDTSATRSRDTTEALAALTAFDSSFPAADRDRAVQWLMARLTANTDEIARIAPALGSSAGSASAGLRAKLRAVQNADGGWGLAAGYGSDPLDTALAVLALSGASDTPAAALDQAAAYLVARQGADGGWSNVAGGASRGSVTAAVLRALKAAGKQDAVAERALTWLATKQNPDGGFGDSPSTAHDTADVLQAVIELGAAARIRAGGAVSYLSAGQTAEGSWEGSAYTTGRVLSALRRSGFPNWRFTGAAQVSPAQPKDGERVTITVTVANDGNLATPTGVLRLYEGDPAAGGTAPGQDVAIPPLAPGRGVTLTLDWDSLDRPGPRTLVAVIDPDQTVAELSEQDNRLAVTVNVQPTPAGVDLAVSAAGITISPAQPATLPVELGITAVVRNLGHAAAGPVTVRLWKGPATTGVRIADVVVNLPDRSSAAANFVYTLTAAGSTLFTVQVDPDNQIAEADEGNNQAAATVTTVSQADLAVTAADLQIAGPAYLGNDATFQVALHNRGTVDAPSVRVRFSIVDSGGTAIELPDSGTVALSAGAILDRTVVWRVDRSGSLRLRVELDPDNQVDEADETNNTAELAFTAGAVDVPNLAVAHTDLTFTPNPAREGKPLTLAAVVRNTGGQPVPAGAEVGFYDGDPRQGGHLIATVQTLPELAPGGAATVSVTWDRYPDSASRVIHVVADPANHVAELREDDNDAFETVTVLSLPDAAISPASLLLTPAVPAPGQAVTLTVTVANLGQQEIAGLVVRAFDGDPAQGAPQLAADQTIALLAGDSTAQVTFAAILGAGAGARPLVVVLDPDGAVDEASKANDTARLDVAPHDGDFYVTERYFSPNGDGVKDTTRFFFRAPAGVVPAAVEAVDARGRVVRRSTGADLAAASFEWDGRDDRGVMAADGDYRLRLVDAQGKEIGAAVATLDTDHWPLFRAFGTPFAAYTNLTCGVGSPASLAWSDDESWLFFELLSSTPGNPAGIYRVTGNGGDAGQILPVSRVGPIVSPDGNLVAIVRNSANFVDPSTLWLADANGSDLRQIADSSSQAWFAADGRSLLSLSDGGYELQRVLLDGTATALLSFSDGGLEVAGMAPDRRSVVVGRDTDLVLLRLDTGATAIIGTRFPNDDDSQRLAWTADSSRLALVEEATGRVLVFDGGDGHPIGAWTVPVTEMADVPEYAVLDAPRGSASIRSLGTPAWSPDGTELALQVLYEESSIVFGRILRLDAGSAASGTFSTVAWLAPQFGTNRAAVRPKTLDPRTGLMPFSLTTGDVVLWARDERSLLYNGADAAWVIDLDDGNSLRAVPDGSFAAARLQHSRFGPTGRRLLFDSDRDAANPQSPCHQSGGSDLFAFQSLLNLTADLRPRRSATEGGILLEGTASDLNFARYTLQYATAAAPGDWRPIGSPSETPVIDGRFATWVPPGPGSYFVRLSVEDLAGNTRQNVQQVSFADTPSISALTVAPAYISPNGDGVQDEAVIQYRVLAPVHLEFQVLNEAGEKVRTIERDHGTVGVDVSVSWDGRDDAGLPVADGFYSITVQSYELFVIVDRTPPQAALSLSSARACDPKRGTVAAVVASYSVDEANPDLKERLESGPGSNPVVWSPLMTLFARSPLLGSTRRTGSVVFSLDQTVDYSFRLVARDLAGNRTVVNAPQVPEELILTGFGRHQIDTDGKPVPLPPFPCVNASFSVEKGLARLAMSETVRTDLAQLLIETQAIPILNGQLRPDLLGNQAWTAAPVTAFFPAQPVGAGVPPTQMEFLWDMNDVRAGVVTAVRVRGVDVQGRQLLSQTFTLATDGVDFHGILSKSDLDNPVLSQMVTAAGLDPDRDLILWGTESIADPIARITLLASSSQDPRYAIPRSLPAVAASGGYFIFNPTDWVSCTGYKGLVIVETAATAGGPGRTLRSPEGLLTLPCLSLDLQWQPVPVGECNSARQSTRRTLVLTPQSKDGRQLQLLTLSGPDENGHDGVLFSITRPESGT
jgi:subtilase family serine protease/flagellar hook assembly protein FlgD